MIASTRQQAYTTGGNIELEAGIINVLTGSQTLVSNLTLIIDADASPVHGMTIAIMSTGNITLSGSTYTFLGTTISQQVCDSNFLAFGIYDADAGSWNVSVASNIDTGTIEEEMIEDNAITLAKLAHLTAGSMYYMNASGVPTELAAGTSGQMLVMNATPIPVWVTMSGDGTIAAGGALTLAATALTGKPEITSTAGTDLVLVSDTSDSGNLKKVELNNLKGSRILDTNLTQTATTAVTTEEDLVSYSMPANTIANNGEVVYIKAYGTTAATANAKTLKLYVGATAQSQNSTTGSPNNLNWICEAWFIRNGAGPTGQKGWVKWTFDGVAAEVDTFSDSENYSAIMEIKITGTNGTAAANDIVFEGWTIVKES